MKNKILILFAFLLSLIKNNEINLSNFDVRDKFRNCYNEGISSTYEEITCYTNWPIQFTLIISDKICIKKGIKTKLISSMNINSCMQIKGGIQNCKTLRDFYNETISTFEVVNETIKFFNEKGSQFIDEFPYVLLRDDDEKPGYFPPCQDFNNSLKNLTVDINYEILEEFDENSFKTIKSLIFEEGPLIAYIDSDRDIFNVDKAIYYPEEPVPIKHDGIKFLRVIGWRTLQGKTFWIFSYTLNENYGLGNYKLIPQKDFKLKFINFKLN